MIRSTRVKLKNMLESSNGDTVRCCRPYKFKNRFKEADYGLDECLRLYEEELVSKLKEDPNYLDELKNLKLACYCKLDEKCHVDIILKYLYKNDYTAIRWEGLTDQQVSNALDQIAKFSFEKRRESQFVVKDIYDSNLKENGLCQECHKKLTGRQKSFCSQECGNNFFARFWWERIRYDVLERDDISCQKCNGFIPDKHSFDIDHINRITDGGLIFSMANYQLLCPKCHKEKSKNDYKVRTTEQLKEQGQTFLDDYLKTIQEES